MFEQGSSLCPVESVTTLSVSGSASTFSKEKCRSAI